MMNKDKDSAIQQLLIWLTCLFLTVVFFYGMDLLVMGMQGLALNADLTPAS